MTTLHTQFAKHSAAITRKLFKLERCGKYEDALTEVKDFWQDLSSVPDVSEFETQIAAEVLLRCGSLLGFVGHIKQIAGSQNNSKDILTEARSRFLDLGNSEKVAECENYLALAYWRTGESREAETWLEESLSHNLSNKSSVKLYSIVVRCLIFLSNEKYKEITQILDGLENDFLCYGDYCLKGDYYNNFGIALNELGNYSKALKYFELARFFYQKSQDKVYLGTAENNLAQLHKLEKRFTKAHEAIDNATKIFKKIKDKTREGFSFDTKAQIFLAERKYNESLNTVEKAISILKKSENLGYLVETLMTKSKILLYLDDFSAAVLCLFDAVKIAEQQGGEIAAQKLVQDFETSLKEKNAPPQEQFPLQEQNESAKIELVLPAELAHYTDIQGVWIKNPHLEKFGLYEGSMAVIAKETIKRGDLAAIVEKENDSVTCGFYDADFGIICLEGIDSEPQLFDENDIEILGKIIGVCASEKTSDGKMKVEPIVL